MNDDAVNDGSTNDGTVTDGRPSSHFADELVDELVPGDLDWRHLVTTYPLCSISLAGIAGFFLGRNHGTTLLTAVSAFMAKEMSRNILTVLDDTVPKASGS